MKSPYLFVPNSDGTEFFLDMSEIACWIDHGKKPEVLEFIFKSGERQMFTYQKAGNVAEITTCLKDYFGVVKND